jgi:glycosyltransferase involved in cell wall biosynthesis
LKASRVPLRVCFVLGDVGSSGGVRVVAEHARGLASAHGMDVSIAIWSAPSEVPDFDVPLLTLDEAREREFDVAIATWWRTAYELFSLKANRYAYFVQQLDERVYRPGDVERLGATATHALPVAFLTEAAWISEVLGELRPDASCFHVSNGIDKRRFTPPSSSQTEGPLRVLVEGSAGLWFKGVREAVAVLGRTSGPLTTTLVAPERPDAETARRFDRVVGPLGHDEMADLYRETDVLLKLSRVEGMFMPPLEAFHCGATCVVWPVTGHDEYIRHLENGVVTDFDDLPGTAAWIDLLSRDRSLLERLRRGALETAARWPSWDAATSQLAAALREIADRPPPGPTAGASRLLADLDAGMEEQRLAQVRLTRAAQAAEQERRQLEERLAGSLERLAAIESSRAWRLSKPLRRLLAPRR